MAIEFGFVLGTPLPAAQVACELHDVAETLGLFDATVTPTRSSRTARKQGKAHGSECARPTSDRMTQ